MKAIFAASLVLTAVPAGVAHAQETAFRSGPHWMPAMAQGEGATYRCRDGAIVRPQFRQIDQPGQATGPRRQILSLSLGNVAVGRELIADLNHAMRAFAREPVFSPQCFRGNYRVHLFLVEGGQVTQSRYVDLDR